MGEAFQAGYGLAWYCAADGDDWNQSPDHNQNAHNRQSINLMAIYS